MPQQDPLDRPGSDEPVGAPGGTRHKAPLQFPRRGTREGEGLNVWRITLYFVLLVIALAVITYIIVHPR